MLRQKVLVQGSALPLAAVIYPIRRATSLIGKETFIKANIEYRIMNIECRSETNLRYSAVRCSNHVKFHTKGSKVGVL
jgi:hypothetical protein